MPNIPILPGFHPDPSICRSPAGYFLVNSSCEYFPGIPLFHSENLREWKQIGHVLDRSSQLDLSGAGTSDGIYAPTIREHRGTFHVITTLVNAGRRRGNFLVTTQDPFGDWSDPLWLDEVDGIDPDLFWDTDGTAYVNWSRKKKDSGYIRIGQAAIDLESGRLLEPARDLWDGTGGLGPEGPHIYRIGDWYYLFIAEGGTEYGHMQVIARSRSVRGPWESCPRNPVLTHRSTGSPVHAVGHADLVTSPAGNWYGVVHGIRPRGYHRFHVLGRETFLFPLQWEADGWPVLGENGRLTRDFPEVDGELVVPEPTDFTESFDSAVFPPEWNFIRNPARGNYHRKGDGQLVLHSSGECLHEADQPTWTGVRQRSHCCHAEAFVEFESSNPGSECGLTALQNFLHYACIGFRNTNEGPRLFTRIRLNEIVVEEDGPLLEKPRRLLRIEAEDRLYRLGCVDDSGKFTELCRCEARFLSTEVSGMFTGVYFGLHAAKTGKLYCNRFEVLSKT